MENKKEIIELDDRISIRKFYEEMKNKKQKEEHIIKTENMANKDWDLLTKETKKEKYDAMNFPPLPEITPEQQKVIDQPNVLLNPINSPLNKLPEITINEKDILHYITKNKSSFASTETNPHWIQTFLGNKFYIQYPEANFIDIVDIAHALANQCRFTGHSNKHYSVAQHSVLVSYLCLPENSLYGVLHDASEAFISDIASPFKKLPELEGYRQLEKKVQAAIMKQFGLPEEEPKDVKRADLMVLSIESASFLTPREDWKFVEEAIPTLKIEALSPADAKQAFLKRFYQLTKNRNVSQSVRSTNDPWNK